MLKHVQIRIELIATEIEIKIIDSMKCYKTYYIEYLSKQGKYKVFRSKKTNCIVEFEDYTLALHVKNWFQNMHWCANAEIKEIYY